MRKNRGGGGQDVRDFELGHFAITLRVLTKKELISFYYKTDRLFWFFRIYHKILRHLPASFCKALQILLPANRKTHPYRLTLSEPSLGAVIPLESIPSDTRVFGYYGNLAYITGVREILCQEFTCPLSAANAELQKRILATPNATFIHIRRGDYLRLWVYAKLGKAYYERAIAEVLRRVERAHFFVFSNDMQWCKQEFLALLDSSCYEGCDFTFVDNNDESNPTEELMLMRSCDHAIVANSTFSWWGAYLIQNPHKVVVMPSIHLLDRPECTNNIMPEDWIVLDPVWGSQQVQSPRI